MHSLADTLFTLLNIKDFSYMVKKHLCDGSFLVCSSGSGLLGLLELDDIYNNMSGP